MDSASDEWLKDWSEVKQEVKEESTGNADVSPKSSVSCDANQKEDIPVQEVCQPPTEGRVSEISDPWLDPSGKENVGKEKHTKSKEPKLRKNAPSFVKGHNLCKFQCPDCEEKFNSWNAFMSHVRKSCHCNGRVSANEIDHVMTKSASFICKLCESTILSDAFFMTHHARARHKMSLTKWSKYCSDEVIISKNTKNHSRDLQTDESVLRVKKAVASSSKESDHDENLGKFQCLTCKEIFSSSSSIVLHLNKPMTQCFGTKGKMRVKILAAYTCKLCSKRMSCDKDAFENHCRRQHKMSLKQYWQEISFNEKSTDGFSQTSSSTSKTADGELLTQLDDSTRPGPSSKRAHALSESSDDSIEVVQVSSLDSAESSTDLLWMPPKCQNQTNAHENGSSSCLGRRTTSDYGSNRKEKTDKIKENNWGRDAKVGEKSKDKIVYHGKDKNGTDGVSQSPSTSSNQATLTGQDPGNQSLPDLRENYEIIRYIEGMSVLEFNRRFSSARAGIPCMNYNSPDGCDETQCAFKHICICCKDILGTDVTHRSLGPECPIARIRLERTANPKTRLVGP